MSLLTSYSDSSSDSWYKQSMTVFASGSFNAWVPEKRNKIK